MATILDQIMLNIEKHERKTGSKPTRLYLGSNQLYELIEIDNITSISNFKGRKTVLGLPIYLVNDHNHFYVA